MYSLCIALKGLREGGGGQINFQLNDLLFS